MFATKLRAKIDGDVVRVMALINHPMTSDLARPMSLREFRPSHFITDIVAEHNNNRVFTANWSGAISKNPYFEFRFKGARKGDVVKLRWIDNHGNSRSVSTRVS